MSCSFVSLFSISVLRDWDCQCPCAHMGCFIQPQNTYSSVHCLCPQGSKGTKGFRVGGQVEEELIHSKQGKREQLMKSKLRKRVQFKRKILKFIQKRKNTRNHPARKILKIYPKTEKHQKFAPARESTKFQPTRKNTKNTPQHEKTLKSTQYGKTLKYTPSTRKH